MSLITCFDNSIPYSTQNVKYPERNISAEVENRSPDISISNSNKNSDKEKASLLGKLKENEALVKSGSQQVKQQIKSKDNMEL